MLRKLYTDLTSSSYRGLRFVIVNSRSDSSSGHGPGSSLYGGDVDGGEDPDALLSYAAGEELIVLKDDEYSRIKHGLGADDNHVLVVDRCGKLAYQIINPWSLIQFPYVKAAILSTYHDEPCGACKIQIMEEITKPHEEQNRIEESTTEEIPVLSEDIPVDITQILNNTTSLLNHTIDEHRDNSSNSKIFILEEEEGSGELDNELISPAEHFDPELLKSYGIQLPEIIDIAETSFGNISENENQTDAEFFASTESVKDIYSSSTVGNSDSLEYSTNNITLNKTDISMNITNNIMQNALTDDKITNKTHVLMNDTMSGHFLLKEDLEGDRVGEVYSHSNMSSWNEHDYVIEDEENHIEKSTPNPIDCSTNPKESVTDAILQEDSEITLGKQNSVISKSDMMDNRVDNIGESNWEIFRGFPRGSTSTRRVHKQKNEDHLVPIRIIFHSPHVHTTGRFIKKHEYVVLKTGQPDFHGHLEKDHVLEEGSGAIEDDLSAPYVDARGNKYTKLDQGKFRDDFGNILDSFDGVSLDRNGVVDDEVKVEVDTGDYGMGQSKDEIGQHYQRLLPWINHILNHDNDRHG